MGYTRVAHRTRGLERQSLDLEDLSRSQGLVVTFFATGNEHIAIGQNRGAWSSTQAVHFCDLGELASSRVIELSRIRSARAHPASCNQHFS